MIKTRSFLLFKLTKNLPLVRDYEFGKNYRSFKSQKFIKKTSKVKPLDNKGIRKIHYASGGKYFQDWINVDFHRRNSFLIPNEIIKKIS